MSEDSDSPRKRTSKENTESPCKVEDEVKKSKREFNDQEMISEKERSSPYNNDVDVEEEDAAGEIDKEEDDSEFRESFENSRESNEELSCLISQWSNENPTVNVEYPHPSKTNPENYCWYDLSEEWTELECPKAAPTSYHDKTFKYGHTGYVKLPFAVSTNHPCEGLSKRPKHELVYEALRSFSTGIRDLGHLQSGINSYAKIIELKTLNRILRNGDAEHKSNILRLIEKIASLALRSDKIISKPLPLILCSGFFSTTKSVSMSQEQAACLLAYAFFVAIERQGNEFNRFDFRGVHIGGDVMSMTKMQFILNYFRIVTAKMPTGTLTFSRQEYRSRDFKYFTGWTNLEHPLSPMFVTHKGLIEEMDGCLQVDFANKYIGGGVLGYGAVQEEIRFLCCPEMIVSLLLFDKMEKLEAIIIQGALQYSSYTGYASTLKWKAHAMSYDVPRDIYGRARSYLVAIDAIPFDKPRMQYNDNAIEREVKKAFAGFMKTHAESSLRPIATGNWGCGAFNGDKELKSLLQLVAASRAGRPLIYLTFNEKKFAKNLEEIYDRLKETDIRIGLLYKWLESYKEDTELKYSVFEYVHSKLNERQF